MIAYKYKLYTSKQTKHLDTMLREAAWVWNHALALQKRYYRMYHKYIDVVRLKGKWVRWFGKSGRLHSQTVQEIMERLLSEMELSILKIVINILSTKV